MAIDLRSYGRLPLLAAAWCFWGTCFYSFLVYQMYGERGRRNRVSIYTTAVTHVGRLDNIVQSEYRKIRIRFDFCPHSNIPVIRNTPPGHVRR